MRVIRQPYLVDRLVVTELNRETPSLAVIYKNEFDMAIAAFILQNNDTKKLKVSRTSVNYELKKTLYCLHLVMSDIVVFPSQRESFMIFCLYQ